jgi:hypothetical protein
MERWRTAHPGVPSAGDGHGVVNADDPRTYAAPELSAVKEVGIWQPNPLRDSKIGTSIHGLYFVDCSVVTADPEIEVRRPAGYVDNASVWKRVETPRSAEIWELRSASVKL